MDRLTNRCNSHNVPDNRESQSGNKFSISRFGSISVSDSNPTISDRTGAEVLPVHATLTFRVRRSCESRSKRNGSTNKSCGACIGLIVIATRFLQAGIAVIRQFARGFIGALRIDMQPWNTSQFDWAVSSSSWRAYPRFRHFSHRWHNVGVWRSAVRFPAAEMRTAVQWQ